MSELAKRRCVPCEGGFPVMTPEQAKDMMEHVPQWKLSNDGRSIRRAFGFKDFKTAHAFVDDVAKIADEEWHHPEIRLMWGSVEIILTTHSISGLSENDYIVAAKIDLLPEASSK